MPLSALLLTIDHISGVVLRSFRAPITSLSLQLLYRDPLSPSCIIYFIHYLQRSALCFTQPSCYLVGHKREGGSTVRSPLHLKEKIWGGARGCVISTPDASLCVFNNIVPDVGPGVQFRSCQRGESCDLCEAGSHISTRGEQQLGKCQNQRLLCSFLKRIQVYFR